MYIAQLHACAALHVQPRHPAASVRRFALAALRSRPATAIACDLVETTNEDAHLHHRPHLLLLLPAPPLLLGPRAAPRRAVARRPAPALRTPLG